MKDSKDLSNLTKSQKMSLSYQRIMVSKEAYAAIKKMAEDPKYYKRGMVGVIDDVFLGEFTTIGSGRLYGT